MLLYLQVLALQVLLIVLNITIKETIQVSRIRKTQYAIKYVHVDIG